MSEQIWTHNVVIVSSMKFEKKFAVAFFQDNSKEILEYLLTIKMKLTGKHVDNSWEVAMDLKLQWIYCNVYPLTVNEIKNRIDSIFGECTYLMKVSDDKKKDTHWNRYLLTIRFPSAILSWIHPNTTKTVGCDYYR